MLNPDPDNYPDPNHCINCKFLDYVPLFSHPSNKKHYVILCMFISVVVKIKRNDIGSF